MNRKLVLCLLSVLILACGVAAPTAGKAGVIPAPVITSTPQPVYTPVPSLAAEIVTIYFFTDTNIRECANVSCAVVEVAQENTAAPAICNDGWCYIAKRGWFCQDAANGGTCEP